MGLNTSLGIGSARSVLPHAADLGPAARFLDAADSDGSHRQLLIRTRALDQPGNAAKLAQVLLDGCIGPEGVADPLSIQESFTARVGPYGVMNLVVGAPVGATAVPDLADQLRVKIDSALPGATSCVEAFADGKGLALFELMEFKEVRFGVERSRSNELAKIAFDFARTAGFERVPIAYMYFPFRWPEHRGASPKDELLRGLDWLRIAYGVSRLDGLKTVRLQNASQRVAGSHDAFLGVYDAVPGTRTMSERFSIYSPAGRAEVESSFLPTNGEVRTETEEARPGLVGERLGALLKNQESVMGGAMAVLRGRSVMSWFVGDSVQVATADGLSARNDDRYPSGRHMWVAWRCSDSPGVFSRILAALLKVHPQANLEHSMTRVLRIGHTCAGKLLFSLPDPLEQADRVNLQNVIRGVLASEVANWHPEEPHWLDAPVMVDTDEPAESPWAEIVL